MTDRETLLKDLGRIVGPGHVLTAARETRRFTKGFRYGGGAVAALCVHGDSPGAVEIARRVRAGLEEAGVRLTPFVGEAA